MITLYSNNCPKCKILKEKLDKNKIGYDLCSDMELMISKGFKSLPMLEIGGKLLTYFEAIKWIKEEY